MDAPGTMPTPRPAAAGDAAPASQPVHVTTIFMHTSALRSIFGARNVEAAMALVWAKVWDSLPIDDWKLDYFNPHNETDSGQYEGQLNTVGLPLPNVSACVEHRVGFEMAR